MLIVVDRVEDGDSCTLVNIDNRMNQKRYIAVLARVAQKRPSNASKYRHLESTRHGDSAATTRICSATIIYCSVFAVPGARVSVPVTSIPECTFAPSRCESNEVNTLDVLNGYFTQCV